MTTMKSPFTFVVFSEWSGTELLPMTDATPTSLDRAA
jgi:hypothetical protein